MPESNASCFYLADGSGLVLVDRFERADTLRWIFFEQYQHEQNIATLRFWLLILGEAHLDEERRGLLPGKRATGEAALALMDKHLSQQDWSVGKGVTLADICLFAYVHVAHEGAFS